MEMRPIATSTPAALHSSDKSISGAEQSALSAPIIAAPTNAMATQPMAPAPSPGEIELAVKNINMALQKLSQNIVFSVDAESNRTIVKVIDRQTHEIIRQMPSAEALEISKALDRVQGLLLKQKI